VIDLINFLIKVRYVTFYRERR